MSVTRYNQMPIAKCPHCKADIELRDWYDFVGDNEERECPKCEQVFYVTHMEAIMEVTLATTKDEQ